MIRAENAYYVVTVPPRKHVYTYDDIEFPAPGVLASPIADSSLLTLLSTGYNGTMGYEYADSRAVYEYVEYEEPDGTIRVFESRPDSTEPWWFRLWIDGQERQDNRSVSPYKICIRTGSIWKTADGYAASGRIFYEYVPYSGAPTTQNSYQMNCKLSAQVWEQTEKRHVMTMSG